MSKNFLQSRTARIAQSVSSQQAFDEIPVTFKSGKFTLQGVFTSPKAATENTGIGVVLIHGSIAKDRDGSGYGHRPFKDLAEFLASECGISTLRYDKRTLQQSDDDAPNTTMHDLTDDALAAAAFLRKQPGVSREKVVLIGHSEGGMIAASAVVCMKQHKDVAGIVLLGCPGVSGADLLCAQIELACGKAGLSEEACARQVSVARQAYAIVASDKVHSRAARRIDAHVKKNLVEGEDSKSLLGRTDGKELVSKWYRVFLGYDPRHAISAASSHPTLALHGTLDEQVMYDVHFPEVRKALENGHCKTQCISLQGVNHIMQDCENGAVALYAANPQSMSPRVMNIIGAWLELAFA